MGRQHKSEMPIMDFQAKFDTEENAVTRFLNCVIRMDLTARNVAAASIILSIHAENISAKNAAISRQLQAERLWTKLI